MNLRRGFFRIALIFSILVGTVSSFAVLEHAIENKGGIVQRCLPYGLQIRIRDEGIQRTAERMTKQFLNRPLLLPSKTHESFGPDYILFWWRHLAVFSLPGFLAVWFIYGLIRWLFVPFIVTGFKGSS